ncbi:IS110 family transposase [Arthrobacter sp. PAMC25564]|uniref:IS110 family transposase n=1 Tax=Arthrobacter sp. PAMC25564 TaxID=2565366 RepID=UPI0010A23AC5|nr:IS110 family transposase [Arthrobacter sp. PAMC25564]QCB97360.1 IS110 family transposase [Arthrobacter sp. PAMC25564]QCB97926.1 IS110 family transposase [Arthrobacter sp. PAMC25564]
MEVAVIKDHHLVDVFIGVDVGKTNHHAVALNREGKKLLDKALPQDEAKLRSIIGSLTKHGTLLLVVDQPATIGALPVAVAQAAGIMVGYLPGLAMRRIADLHPGEAKTDARDSFIIAEAARTMPHTLRSIAVADEQTAELSMLCGFDDDLAQQATATSNRIRGLLTQIHPALERVIGPHLDHPAMAELLIKYPTPAALRKAGQTRVGEYLRKWAPRAGTGWAAEIFTALSEQTVVVAGTGAAGIVLPRLAAQLAQLRAARAEVLTRVEAIVEAHPLHTVLTSMPAVGARTEARIITEVIGKDFNTAGHLASYSGLAPVTWRSGTSIRGDHPSRKGNKILKRAFFLSAFAALKDPASRAYYDRKRAEGKRHNQALIALARRRCDVLFAMLRDMTLYEAPKPKAA